MKAKSSKPKLTIIATLAGAVCLFAFASTGCANKNASVAKTPALIAHGSGDGSVTSPVALTSANAGTGSNDGVGTSTLRVSDEIARACGITEAVGAPKFGFDSTSIEDDDRAVLTAVARCLTEGNLRSRAVSLTGRADPRGESEYNMTLGENRADSVKRYLRDLGVNDGRMRATSRGELDAQGKDENGWAQDRRVDIALAN